MYCILKRLRHQLQPIYLCDVTHWSHDLASFDHDSLPPGIDTWVLIKVMLSKTLKKVWLVCNCGGGIQVCTWLSSSWILSSECLYNVYIENLVSWWKWVFVMWHFNLARCWLMLFVTDLLQNSCLLNILPWQHPETHHLLDCHNVKCCRKCITDGIPNHLLRPNNDAPILLWNATIDCYLLHDVSLHVWMWLDGQILVHSTLEYTMAVFFFYL